MPPIHVLIGTYISIESPCPQVYGPNITRFVPPEATAAQVSALTNSMWQEWAFQFLNCPQTPPEPPIVPPNDTPVEPPVPPPWIPTFTTLCNTEQSATCTGLATGGPTITVPAKKYCQKLGNDDDAGALQAYLDSLAFVDAQAQANQVCYGQGTLLTWPFQIITRQATIGISGPCVTLTADGSAAGAGQSQVTSAVLNNTTGGNWNVTVMVLSACSGVVGVVNATLSVTDTANGQVLLMADWPPIPPPIYGPCGAGTLNYIVAPGGSVHFQIVASAAGIGVGPFAHISATICIAIL